MTLCMDYGVAECGQFDSARSYGSGKDSGDIKEAMYGVGNLQSSPAMKTFYNKALLSTAGPDMVHDFPLVCNARVLIPLVYLIESLDQVHGDEHLFPSTTIPRKCLPPSLTAPASTHPNSRYQPNRHW